MIGLANLKLLGFLLPNLDGPDILVVGLIALLLFGKRLPDIARSFGRTIVEFKKGLHQTSDEVNQSPANEPPPEKPALTAPPSPNPRQIKQVTNVSEEP